MLAAVLLPAAQLRPPRGTGSAYRREHDVLLYFSEAGPFGVTLQAATSQGTPV